MGHWSQWIQGNENATALTAGDRVGRSSIPHQDFHSQPALPTHNSGLAEGGRSEHWTGALVVRQSKLSIGRPSDKRYRDV